MMTSRLSDKDSRADVMKVFSLFDAEGKGRINLRDLKRVASELGEPITEAELLEMIERADSNGDGEVSAEDFYSVRRRLRARSAALRCAPWSVARSPAPPLPPDHDEEDFCVRWTPGINHSQKLNDTSSLSATSRR